MEKEDKPKGNGFHRKWYFWFFILIILFIVVFFFAPKSNGNIVEDKFLAVTRFFKLEEKIAPKYPPLDVVDYDKRIYALSGLEIPSAQEIQVVEGKAQPKENKDIKSSPWPVKTEYPLDGAILPFHRIVAYYGNLYSKKMGILGEYEEDEMLAKLKNEPLNIQLASHSSSHLLLPLQLRR